MNEIRNELLTILSLEKNNNRSFYLELLLERFEYDLDDKEKDLEYKLQEVRNNKETLKFVRQELGIKKRLNGEKVEGE